MGGLEFFIPIAAILTFAVIVSLITRLIATAMHHRTIREAMRSDPTSVPLLVQRCDHRQRHVRPPGDAARGDRAADHRHHRARLHLFLSPAKRRHALTPAGRSLRARNHPLSVDGGLA